MPLQDIFGEFILLFELKDDLEWRLNYMRHPNYQEICKIALDLIKGVKDLHCRNIVHFDIKPQNIVLGTDLKWKFSDLAVAMKLHSENSLPNNLKGMSVYYSSPEQYIQLSQNTPPITGMASDIYSLGLVFLKLTGKKLQFSEIEKSKQRRYCFSKMLSQKYTEFNQILVKMLQYLPQERPSLDSIEENLCSIIEKSNPSHLITLRKTVAFQQFLPIPKNNTEIEQQQTNSIDSFQQNCNNSNPNTSVNTKMNFNNPKKSRSHLVSVINSRKSSLGSGNNFYQYDQNKAFQKSNTFKSHTSQNSLISSSKDSFTITASNSSSIQTLISQQKMTLQKMISTDQNVSKKKNDFYTSKLQQKTLNSECSNSYGNIFERNLSDVGTDCLDIQLQTISDFLSMRNNKNNELNTQNTKYSQVTDSNKQNSILKVKIKPQFMMTKQKFPKQQNQIELPTLKIKSFSGNLSSATGLQKLQKSSLLDNPLNNQSKK